MKIYREGREIYEIKDYKQIGKFMEVATIEATIKSALPIDIKVGDYVIFDYNNLKYTLYDVYPAKKQARSSTYGEAFVYDLKFKADTEQLSICPFLDLVPNDNNLSYSSLPSFSTFENVYGIADRLQANLDYLYPNQWRFDVVDTTDPELLETLSDAREFAISGESCLEGLRKIYDIWGVGFIHSVEDGVNVITIGKSAGKTSMFRYGKGRGLRTIKKNLQNSDQLCTRAYVFGSTRNIPARWYNNKGYIGEAQFAPNLMIPPSKWANGIPQGAYIDAVFDGVNRIEKYGLKIKTLSYDGSDSKKDEIYPSVEKMTAKIIRDAKAEIGENTYIPSPTLYPDNERMDMVLEGSNIADDGTNSEPGYVLHSDKIIKSIEGQSETITIAEKKGETKYELDRSIQRNINICTFDIEKPASYRIRERLDFVTFKKNDLESTISAILTLQTPSGEYIELRKLAFTDKLEDSLQIPDSTHELKDAGKYTLMLKLGVSWTTDWVVPQIGEDVYLTYNIAETDITLSRGEKILDNFFTIKIKQIGFDINDYTASSGAFKNIHFRSGMCSGMSFNIAKCSYIEEIDAWELKCKRVEDSSISQRFPNSIFNIAKDDRFVLLNINMPDLYVYTAMQRLYDTASEDLKHFSTPQYVIEPQIDNIQMARSPQVLKEGMYMAIDDLDIAILNEEALIDSVTITNRGTDLRSFEVTLRNDKVYNRYNKLADRIADLESAAQKTASNSTITPVQDTSESKIETPAVGFDENALADYLEGNKYTTEGDVTNLLSPIDKEVSTLRTDFDNLNTLLNGNVGGVIDTWNEVVSFLDGYKDSEDLATILSGMNTDIANRVLIEDFEKLEEAVNPLFGYFDANGNANNALKLGGHSADYFATADALNTHITAFNNYKTTTDNRLNKLEDLWYMDKDGNVHTTHNIVVDGGGAFGKGSGGGGGDVGGLGKVTIYLEGSNIPYETNSNGEVIIPAYPTALKNPYALTINGTPYDGSSAVDITISAGGGVADSVDWANVYNKPATLGGYGITDALSTSGGTISSSQPNPLVVNSTYANRQLVEIALSYNNTQKGFIGYYVDGAYIGDSVTGYRIGVRQDGEPVYKLSWSGVEHVLYHTGNFNPADYLPKSGGTIEGGSGALQIKSGADAKISLNNTDSDNKFQYIAFLQNDVRYGYLGTLGNDDLSWSGNIIIHSGNYSSYALPLSGGIISTTNSYYPIRIKCPASYGQTGIRLEVDDTNMGALVSTVGDTYIYNFANSIGLGIYNGVAKFGDNTLIHSGNIGSYNAGSASKLLTNSCEVIYNNRTTLAQFKLTGDKGGYSGMLFRDDSGGLAAIDNGTDCGLFVTNMRWLLAYNRTNDVAWIDAPLSINNKLQVNNGNVLIGTTTDDNSAKLQVEGIINIKKDGYALYWGSNKQYRLGSNGNSDFYIFDDNTSSTAKLRFGTAGADRMTILPNGNVLIGATDDNGAKLQVAGNLTVTGGGAFGSDIRYKDIISYRQINLETIVNAPLFSFRWTDREDKVEHLGTSAQYWLGTQFKDAVNTANKDFFHLDYGALAVGIGISVAREVKGVKTEVEKLREELEQVKQELNYYKGIWHN